MKILLLAGEESGELYARQIRSRLAGHDVRGFGDWGFRTEDLGVMGLDEVLRSIFYLLRVKRTMERAIDTWRPDVVCTIDYPGMNLKLAAYAKARGIRTVHVVCPQVWAWKAGRIPKIECTFDRLCCFFPFEPALFRPGFAEFVGHPLVESFNSLAGRGRPAHIEPCGTDGAHPSPSSHSPALPSSHPPALPSSLSPVLPLSLALLPGSRLGEIEKHLPVMLAAIRDLPSVRVTIPAANEKALAAIGRILAKAKLSEAPEVRLGGARELLLRADCAVVASGTATLEAALANCPTVLVYKAAPLFAFIARRVIKGVRFIGLANIIWDKSLAAKGIVAPVGDAPMPELLQENLTVENLRRHLLPLVTDASARAAAAQRLAEAMKLLRSDGDAIGRIAAIIVNKERNTEE